MFTDFFGNPYGQRQRRYPFQEVPTQPFYDPHDMYRQREQRRRQSERERQLQELAMQKERERQYQLEKERQRQYQIEKERQRQYQLQKERERQQQLRARQRQQQFMHPFFQPYESYDEDPPVDEPEQEKEEEESEEPEQENEEEEEDEEVEEEEPQQNMSLDSTDESKNIRIPITSSEDTDSESMSTEETKAKPTVKSQKPSKLDESKSAETIQKWWRGNKVRKQNIVKQLKQIKDVSDQVEKLKTHWTDVIERKKRSGDPFWKAGERAPKEILAYEEDLIKQLLKLDSITAGQSDIIREQRKKVVGNINSILSQLDKEKKEHKSKEITAVQ